MSISGPQVKILLAGRTGVACFATFSPTLLQETVMHWKDGVGSYFKIISHCYITILTV